MSRLDHVLLVLLLAAMALGAAAALVPVRAQTAPVVLDAFLSGFERSCEFGADYRRFSRALLRHDGRTHALTGETALPGTLRPAFGAAEMHQVEAVAVVTVPVRGLYRGLPVRSLHLLRGPLDSTVGDGVLLDMPVADAHRALDSMVERSRARLGGMEQLDLEEQDGGTLLSCFSTI